MSASPTDIGTFSILTKIGLNKSSNDKQLQEIENNKALQSKLQNINVEAFLKQLMQIILQNLKLSLAEKEKQIQEFLKKNGLGDFKLGDVVSAMRTKDGQSPLQSALQTQNFVLAAIYLLSGAIAGPKERATFALALDSQKAQNLGFKIDRTIPNSGTVIHPVKDYGLVLGVAVTSVDGTYSQFGHVGPTYNMMSNSIDDYASTNSNFSKIADAFTETNKIANFSYSKAQNPNTANELANRIHNSKNGEVTSIPASFNGHVMGLSVISDKEGKGGYVVFTNRGIGSDVTNQNMKPPGGAGTQIYRVDDLSQIAAKDIDVVIQGHHSGKSPEAVTAALNNITGGKTPVEVIVQKEQKNDNCTIANTRANVHGVLLCQQAIEKAKPVQQLDAAEKEAVKKEYKAFTTDMRQKKVEKLADALAKNPQDPDLNTLATTYIANQEQKRKEHPHDVREAVFNSGKPLEAPLKAVLAQNAKQQVIVTPSYEAQKSKM
ncbi:MAG: hypothetical protein WC627_09675 [Legionella sp.]|jgi:hypothetical protein